MNTRLFPVMAELAAMPAGTPMPAPARNQGALSSAAQITAVFSDPAILYAMRVYIDEASLI